MLNLLLAISLNTLHERLHGQVLFLPHLGRLTLHLLHDLEFVLRHFKHLLLVGLHAHELGIVVLLHGEEDFFLVAKGHKVFLGLVLHVTADFIK